jgi:Tfp pilus assembly protein PilV
MKLFRHKNSGFGLIEILVTLGVLSVGILGVTTLHGVIARQSADNKSRSEALSIAQSRLEEMRNYTNSAGTLAEFNTLYADTAGYGNSATVDGISNSYTRTENISTSGTVKSVAVKVDWTDPAGDTQSVALNTEFAFISPRKVGDSALEASDEKVDSPTGRARLGDGTLTDDEVSGAVSNGDGTSEVLRGDDRLLAVGSDVVLTLVEACQTEGGTCAEFVRVKGRIYIDRDELPNLDPGAVHVIASDAAFCARHYIPSGGAEADRTAVSNNDTSTVTTSGNSSGEYEYFDYTCYLGGGWHGNVGILVSGNTSWEGCVGDPTSDQPFDQPIRASRRVYRGMLYKVDNSEADGKELVDGSVLVQYYSQGVGDSLVLPVPGTSESTHDFVLTGAFSASDLNNENPCMNLGGMTRTDSNTGGEAGDRFEGIPDDFYCLNSGYTNATSTLDTIPTGFGVEYNEDYGYTCPYNPADPPASHHHVSGSVTLSAPVTEENTILADGMSAFTSDGVGSCTMGTVVSDVDANTYTNTYDCFVYDWSTTVNDVEVLNGWNGYIEVDYDQSSMSCDPNRITLSDVTTDLTNNDSVNCSPGSFIYFTGTVIDAPNNRELQSVVISDVGGSCTLAMDGMSFYCLTADFPDGVDSWTGTISMTTDTNVVCTATDTGANPGIFSYTNQSSGFVDLSITLATNANACP